MDAQAPTQVRCRLVGWLEAFPYPSVAITSSGFLALALDQYFPESPEEKQLTGRLDAHAMKNLILIILARYIYVY